MLLFAMRVGVQFIQFAMPQSWLPQFSDLQSGALPYHVLLALQIIVLAIGTHISIRIFRGRWSIAKSMRRLMYLVGALYLGFMLLRGVVGIFLPADPFWGKLIPTVFHILLALWILMVAQSGEERK